MEKGPVGERPGILWREDRAGFKSILFDPEENREGEREGIGSLFTRRSDVAGTDGSGILVVPFSVSRARTRALRTKLM